MKRFFIIGIIVLVLLCVSVSAYYCIEQEDNDAVKQFKSNMNILALKHEIQTYNITPEVLYLKIKYFNPCN